MDNQKYLRAGIIGFGSMGKRHAQAYADSGCAEVVAICNRRAFKMTEYLNTHSNCRSYTDWQEMLLKEELDILSVVTYSPSHAEIVIGGTEAGIPRILCEKPMTTRLVDAQTMIDTCRERNIKLSINHGRRWSPPHLQLRELLREGIIGDVRGIVCSLGGGRLGCNGSHMFDLMRMYAESDAEWVIGFIDQTGTPNPRGEQFIDPGGYGQIYFQNGARCYLDMSEDLGIPVRFEIIGSMGRITVDEGMNRWDIIARGEEDKQVPLTNYGLELKSYPFDSSWPIDDLMQTREAIKELCEDKSPSCSGEDGKAALELVMAFHISHKLGNVKIDLPLKDEHLLWELQIT